ncbi:MAG: hypothetical protein E7158_05780 [Firmicutes bacterium]|nr:hypothetical protein [Bacillota bacterium]
MENKRNQLLELREKVAKLNETEKKNRDFYLKKFATGEMYGPWTGLPSIDKPWLKYTDVEKTYSYTDKKTVYQELYDNNKDYPNDLAMEYFGRKISFKELFKNIDFCANSLVNMGIKKGDFVSVCSTCTPEVVYLFYACAKMGAIINFIPPYFSEESIHDRLNDCKSTKIFVLDKCYDLIKKPLENTHIDNVVVIPFFNSSPLKYIKPTKKIKDLTYWYDFINNNSRKVEANTISYEEKLPLALIYSSGSTGDAKSILLTHDSFQESIHSYDSCGIVLDRKQKFYQLIPPWVSTGLSTSVHLPLSKGISIFMDPRFDKKVFVKNIIKHKLSGTVATATMYDGFVECKISKKADLSNFNNAFEGGEPLKKERKERIEKVLREHGAKNDLMIGYGQCESGSGITTQTPDFYRSDESVGIPIPGDVAKVVDDNFNELGYGQKGQLLVKTKTAMKEYYNNPEATSKYFYIDEFGDRWSCTGDLASIDKEGMVYLYGRMSDFSMINGEKIYNFDVEKVILRVQGITNCAVVTGKDETGNDMLSVHLVVDSNIQRTPESIISEIQDLLYNEYSNMNYVPYAFKFRETIPVSKTSKRDNIKMKSETTGFIYNHYTPNTMNLKKVI